MHEKIIYPPHDLAKGDAVTETTVVLSDNVHHSEPPVHQFREEREKVIVETTNSC